LLLSACRGSLSPLSNKLQVGEEPYVIFAADGEAGVGDLFAAKPAGGAVYQVTFTRVDERLPALSPDGTMLAFLRVRAPGPVERQVMVVMNLLNGAERQLDIVGGVPEALAWSADGRNLYLQRGDSVLKAVAPPARLEIVPVLARERATADSALAVLLGEPPLAEAVPCDGGGICALFSDGTRQTIAPGGAEAARWIGDSILYREAGEWVIRPLAGGRPRLLRVSTGLGHMRSVTVFRGSGRRPE
jgi:hypothetical protein